MRISRAYPLPCASARPSMSWARRADLRLLRDSRPIQLPYYLRTRKGPSWLRKNVSCFFLFIHYLWSSEPCMLILSHFLVADIALSHVLEGFVLLRKNPDFMEEDKE